MSIANVFSIFAVVPAVVFAAPVLTGEPGFTPLFNGRDLEGWEGATNTYCVTSDGLLTCRQGSVGGKKAVRNLWTKKDYADGTPVGYAIRLDGMSQGADDMFLPNDVVKRHRAVLERKRNVSRFVHRPTARLLCAVRSAQAARCEQSRHSAGPDRHSAPLPRRSEPG